MNEKQTPEKGVCVCVKPVSSGVLFKMFELVCCTSKVCATLKNKRWWYRALKADRVDHLSPVDIIQAPKTDQVGIGRMRVGIHGKVVKTKNIKVQPRNSRLRY